ncbi:hypothetical protein [Enterobacter pseudoroggenkampii]|uniref:hypothetical protein n=1 Tax=Enterobacter pseudoroggenkampii TaxID=2996112 RepID=UPI0038AFB849
MGLYLNEDVLSNITLVNSLITRELSEFEQNNLFDTKVLSSKIDLLNTTLITAWKVFFSHLKNEQRLLDDNTQFNQELIPQYISFNVDMYSTDKAQFLSDLLRVLYEFNFWTGKLRGENIISDDILTRLSDAFDNEGNRLLQFGYIRDVFSVTLVQWLLKSQSFSEAKNLIKNIQDTKEKYIEEATIHKVECLNEISLRESEASKKINDDFSTIKHEINTGRESVDNSIKSIRKSLEEIRALEKRVQDLKAEYNFVGLSSGFNKIKEKKDVELRNVEMNYKNLFGGIFIAPVFLTILHFGFPGMFPKDFTAVFLALPFFTIEMALIYFFRLSYLEAKSIRTQLVQIELRLSLCSFIDGYVEYRKKNNVNYEKVLDSFDALIFSPIQTNENNIPSMFDGVEVLAGLAEKITKK